MKLKMDNSYKSENYLRERKSNIILAGTTSAKDHGTTWLKSNTDTGNAQGIQYTLRLMALKCSESS